MSTSVLYVMFSLAYGDRYNCYFVYTPMWNSFLNMFLIISSSKLLLECRTLNPIIWYNYVDVCVSTLDMDIETK